jgi:hypothetical protein
VAESLEAIATCSRCCLAREVGRCKFCRPRLRELRVWDDGELRAPKDKAEEDENDESRGIDRLNNKDVAAADGAALEEEDGAAVANKQVVRSLELRKATAGLPAMFATRLTYYCTSCAYLSRSFCCPFSTLSRNVSSSFCDGILYLQDFFSGLHNHSQSGSH